CILLK
ncbi:hypothetical protein VCHC50A2_3679B, partial [Vibrio cholerae HC-50A2]